MKYEARDRIRSARMCNTKELALLSIKLAIYAIEQHVDGITNFVKDNAGGQVRKN